MKMSMFAKTRPAVPSDPVELEPPPHVPLSRCEHDRDRAHDRDHEHGQMLTAHSDHLQQDQQ